MIWRRRLMIAAAPILLFVAGILFMQALGLFVRLYFMEPAAAWTILVLMAFVLGVIL